MGANVIYTRGIVQGLPRGRFWGAGNLPGYNLGGGYIFRLYTGRTKKTFSYVEHGATINMISNDLEINDGYK